MSCHRVRERFRRINMYGALLVMLTLTGCSSASKSTSPHAIQRTANSVKQTANPARPTETLQPPALSNLGLEPGEPTLAMTLESPVALEPISSYYTCAGANVPPPLAWSKPPRGTAELDVLLMREKEREDGTVVGLWGIAGIPPSRRKLAAAHPRGTISGRNYLGQAGYSLCPPKGVTEHFILYVFAPTHRLSLKPGFAVGRLVEAFLHSKVLEGIRGFVYSSP